jgi:Spy/CpxP family protein refolding chaperone
MKLTVITLTALTALSLGSAALAQDEDNDTPRHHGGRGMRHDPIARMTESLDLTADQKAKVQPIMDEARPKMEAIHREAMEKAKAVIDDAMTKIRPLLTPDQQKKLDDAKNNHRGFGGKKARPDDDGSGD